jgi:exopolyphosphatase/guanosine-5'-triphosphate,3'-diphosphate pyrophosphatase
MSGRTVAAIDCGTNSTRLLVARVGDDVVGEGGRRGIETLERTMTITRLGQGVDADGALADEAIDRTVMALAGYRAILDRYEVDAIRMTATSAARDASNRDEFFAAAEAVVGAEPELLSGTAEAQLSFAGAVNDLDPLEGPFLVVDIGGGSTEFAYGSDTVLGSHSADMGCVRITERFFENDPPRPEELTAALSVVELHLDDVVREIPGVAGAKRLVGLAGTVSAAAAIEQGLESYDRDRIHHFELTKAAAEDVFRTLATETRAQRLENPGMEEGRVDVIVGGMVVLVRIMRQFGFDSCLVSEADILDGLALSLR